MLPVLFELFNQFVNFDEFDFVYFPIYFSPWIEFILVCTCLRKREIECKIIDL